MLGHLIVYSGFAGATVFLGAWAAHYFDHHVKESPVKYQLIHSMMSFGAGVMLSALALVLIPEGMHELNLFQCILSFLLGSVSFYYLDRYLAKKGGQTATLIAMLMDFIPEAIALGAIFAIAPDTATLLAVFIGLQNFPESFNAFRDMVLSGHKPKKALYLFFGMSFLGILSALIGYYLLTDHKDITALLMMYASGGILYLLIQDIIPESKLDDAFSPSLGACLGFLIGIIGDKLT